MMQKRNETTGAMKMMHQRGTRDLLNRHMDIGREYQLSDEIYVFVERHGELENEDLAPSGPGKKVPRWHETVKKALHEAQKRAKS